MRLGGCTRAVLAAAAVTAIWAPGAAAQAPVTHVEADGNFLGVPEPLRFQPRDVQVPLGGVVRWRNTDLLVPHTATEDHGLWNLTGTFGIPGSPSGFAPGETRERPFAAGTWSYFCEVHPVDMRGTVTVPLQAQLPTKVKKGKKKKGKKKKGTGKGRAAANAKKKRKRKKPRYEVLATWAQQPLPSDQVFEVQRRFGDGEFTTVKEPTRALSGRISVGRAGRTVSLRVRVLAETEPSRASGYSPVVTFPVGPGGDLRSRMRR